MKAIKDLVWEVDMVYSEMGNCWWVVQTKYQTVVEMTMEGSTETIRGAKRNWERFAKVNKIKYWRYV